MESEYLYFAFFVLAASVLILGSLRMGRAAKTFFETLRQDIRRDRRQRERIEREKRFQSKALRHGTRQINGKKRKVSWDQDSRRARRDYHVDEAADEVFDPVSNRRGMDIRTPWGWPQPQGYKTLAHYRHKTKAPRTIGNRLSGLFRTKQLVDEEVRARRHRSIRALVEDRYGRVGANAHMPDIEWSKPELPQELLEERATDQMFAWKPPQDGQAAESLGKLRLVGEHAENLTAKKQA